MSRPAVIIIEGPTASGKTGLAIELAQYFHTEILSADSRQCYRELNIGVAKPSVEELVQVRHYFISSHTVHENINAGVYERYALQCLNQIFSKHNIALVVGGTGLYARALCEGVDEMPEISRSTRAEVVRNYEEKGLAWLQEEVRRKDIGFWEKAEQQNPHRLMRALEFIMETGTSITHFRSGQKVERPFDIIKIVLNRDRQDLYDRINRRVDVMMAQGLEAEARALLPVRHLDALQTVGYRELFDYFDHKVSLPEAVETIKRNTRHYAKRQITWFKKEEKAHWFHPMDKENILSCVQTLIG